MMGINIERLPLVLHADPSKVIMRYWHHHDPERLSSILNRFEQLDPDQRQQSWKETRNLFIDRHRDFEQRLRQHAHQTIHRSGTKLEAKGDCELLLGAYFTMEYAIEASALFNPSIVSHPDQTGLQEGATRFVLSLRAVGEGHISSIEFREGVIEADNKVTLVPDTGVRTPACLSTVDDEHYTATFDLELPFSERVLFPAGKHESNGMEDLRLVEFTDAQVTRYFGTYTAYNGREIRSKLIETRDFHTLEIRSLEGNAIRGKGIAIFPKKIKGRYAAIGRQDNESMTIMYSNDALVWNSMSPLLAPKGPHELIQIGNCGAPIETPDGWLLLTHGVGPLRRYTLGVALLDLEHPERVLGVLPVPLMEPLETERSGYVPNVLYTCGWMQHGDQILIPYAMSDTSCGFAIVATNELVMALKEQME